MENGSLINSLTTVEQELVTVKRECTEIVKSRDMELSGQLSTLQSEKQRLQDHLVRVQTDLIDNNNRMQSLQQELLVRRLFVTHK